MGNTTGRAQGGGIVYVPGPNGGETRGSFRVRRGESTADAIARAGINTRGARILPLTGEEIRAAGGARNFRDVDIRDFVTGPGARGRRFVDAASVRRAADADNRIGLRGAETRAAAQQRRAAAGMDAARRALAGAQARRRRVLAQIPDNASARTRNRRLAASGVSNAQIDALRDQLARQRARRR